GDGREPDGETKQLLYRHEHGEEHCLECEGNADDSSPADPALDRDSCCLLCPGGHRILPIPLSARPAFGRKGSPSGGRTRGPGSSGWSGYSRLSRIPSPTDSP